MIQYACYRYVFAITSLLFCASGLLAAPDSSDPAPRRACFHALLDRPQVPLLIINGEKDPNCPLEGAELAYAAAEAAYRRANAEDKLQMDVAPGVGHTVTAAQHEKAMEWLTRWLAPSQPN